MRFSSIFILSVCSLCFFGFYKVSQGFFSWNFYSLKKGNSHFIRPPTSPSDRVQLKKTLNQPYYFTGKEKDFFILKSADSQYLLKIYAPPKKWGSPKFFSTNFPFWLNQICLESYEQYKEQCNQKINSLILADRYLKKQCGLQYIQINPSSFSLPPLQVIDALKKRRRIPLDHLVWTLQTTGTPLLENSNSLLESDLSQLAKDAARVRMIYPFHELSNLYFTNKKVCFSHPSLFEYAFEEIDCEKKGSKSINFSHFEK